MRTAKCKGCDAEIIWAITEGGKLMPLDAKARTMFQLVDLDSQKFKCQAVRVYEAHWATCTHAESFKK